MTSRPAPDTSTGRRSTSVATHVLVDVPWGAAWTTVVGGGLVAAALAFPIGLPVAAATLLLVPVGAELERDRAMRLVGHRPERAEPLPRGRLLDTMRAHLQSRSTWREALHLLTLGPVALLMISFVVAWALATGAALTSGWWLSDGSVPVGSLRVPRPLVVSLLATNGAAALLAGPVLMRGMAALRRGVTLVLLGPGRDGWRARVEDAEHRRSLLARAARAERERIERDLHDGLQPVLVSTAVTIAGARRLVSSDPDRAIRDLEDAQTHLQRAMDDVRSIVQGLAPRSLRESGLDAALGELAAGMPVPASLVVELPGDLDDEVAAAAYFVASEAATNAVRHGAVGRVEITAASAGGFLNVSVVDDGIGGAVTLDGHGLEGLDARVRAIGGRLLVESPAGAGTTVAAELPMAVGR